jgi:hypothetical protein
VVCGYVAVGNGENGDSLLDHQAITSDESSRAAYLERENARLQRLSQNCWSRMSSCGNCIWHL